MCPRPGPFALPETKHIQFGALLSYIPLAQKRGTPAETDAPARLSNGRQPPPRSFLVGPDPYLDLLFIEDSLAYVLMLTQKSP